MHRNSFGFIRLLFASLVIISHTSEIRYGSSVHEPLKNVFGTISLGFLAVCGFFVVSGYLIVGSYLKRPHLSSYLVKRVARIYPAFLVASLVCIFMVVPLGGGTLPTSWRLALQELVHLAVLKPPLALGAFSDTFYPVVNGVLWSIAAEFRCYILVAVFGLTGLLTRRTFMTSLGATLLLAPVLLPDGLIQILDRPSLLTLLLGEQPSFMAQMFGLFLCGSSFYLWRDRIVFHSTGCLIAAAGLFFSLSFPDLAIIGAGTFGAYLIFAYATKSQVGLLSTINNKNDISYGVYLYAWPTCKLLILYLPILTLLQTGVLTFAIAYLCGWLSWHFVEKPVMQILRTRDGRPVRSAIVAEPHETAIRAMR